MAREELRSRLGVAAASFPAVVRGLVEDGRVVERNGSLAAPAHSVTLDPTTGPAAELVTLLARESFTPTSLGEAMQQTGATEETDRALVQCGEIVRLSSGVALAMLSQSSMIAEA